MSDRLDKDISGTSQSKVEQVGWPPERDLGSFLKQESKLLKKEIATAEATRKKLDHSSKEGRLVRGLLESRLTNEIGKVNQTLRRMEDATPPAVFLHCAIFMADKTILSDETFRLVNFEGQEAVSQPFEYQLELHGNTSSNQGRSLSFDDLIGRPVTIGIQYPSDYTMDELSFLFRDAITSGKETGPELALFNGIVTSFSMEIPGVYRATMKPALSRLALTNRYEIHSRKSIRGVISEVLDRHNILYSMEAVSGEDNPAVARVQDWLQAGETDLDFIQRMMSKAHLFFYVVHTVSSHTLVFVNRMSYSYPSVFKDNRPLRYAFTSLDELGLAQSDVISQYSFQRSMTPSGVHGIFTRQEAAWESDAVAQFQTFTSDSQKQLGQLPFNQYKIYQYGCSKDEVTHFTDSTNEALVTSGSRFTGSSYCAHFRIGHQFKVSSAEDEGQKKDSSAPGADQKKSLAESIVSRAKRVARALELPLTKPKKEAPAKQVQPSLEGCQFVLTTVRHQANADGGYRNEFESTEASGFLTPFSIQETQQGAVLAQVVAKPAPKAPANSSSSSTSGQTSQAASSNQSGQSTSSAQPSSTSQASESDSSANILPQDWRYYPANCFDPETNDLTDGNSTPTVLKAMGVYVRFATDPQDSDPVWVKLSASMQTVPEIGVTVVVTRAQDESELPEIQNIIQANGSKVIMPSNWTANTHVGSSYSTNYGDSQGIRFGKNSPTNLTKAISIVSDTYQTNSYRDTSYSQGAGYSFACADSQASQTPNSTELFGTLGTTVTDLLSASESFGSNFSRQYAQVSSSFANIGTSYSNSTIGTSESTTLVTGTSTSTSTYEGDITNTTTITANSVSTTTQTGNTTNTTTQTGNTTNTSTQTGSVSSTSTVNGASTSTATYNGTVDSTNNHHGTVTSTTHHFDDVTSTNIVDGTAKSTNMNHFVINLSSTAAQTSSSATGASNSNDVVGASNRNSATGISVDLTAAVSTNSVNAIGSQAAINITGVSTQVELLGVGYSFSNKAGNPRLETVDFRLTMVEILQIYL